MAAKDMPEKGDAVRWNTSQGETQGHVERVVTHTTHVAGHTARATPEAPQVVVKSDKTGHEAVHKPGALKQR